MKMRGHVSKWHCNEHGANGCESQSSDSTTRAKEKREFVRELSLELSIEPQTRDSDWPQS